MKAVVMNKDKYPMYGLAPVVGGGLAVWAGLPPTLLLAFLVCPLMMFFMMRGVHGGQGKGADSGHHDASVTGSDTQERAASRQSWRPDGSHERIDSPE